MTKKCTTCGENFTGELFPSKPSSSCPSCESTPRRRHRRTGIVPCGCGAVTRSACICTDCTNVVRTRVTYPNSNPCALGVADPATGEMWPSELPIPMAATQCRPFTKDSFAMIDVTFGFPKDGDTSRTEISNVILAEGQPITHPSYGTLIAHPVIGKENTYDLESLILSGNPLSSVGKAVPCGERFFLGYPVIDQSPDTSQLLECNALLEDFTVPEINSTAEAVVSTYVGLKIDDHVILRNKVDPNLSYTYRVAGATGLNTLILENEGDGGTVGITITAASDVPGEYAWCISNLKDTSACTQSSDTVCMAHILGCDDEGNPRRLSGTIANEAPVWDTNCNGFSLKVIPKPVVCVLLDSCFQIAPVNEICNRNSVTITTLDDQTILDQAEASLLSVNADPLITICDRPFSINMDTSVVGALVITPNFNPTVIENFDRNCKVCVPEDCCFQCNPQVNYPVDSYNPPGLNKSLNVTIPTTIITGFGEYKMSVVKRPDTQADVLLVHNTSTNVVTAAYDTNGNPIVLGTLPGDPNEYVYNSIDYCNESVCPVDVNYEEDINVRFYGLILGEEISFNYHTQFDVYNCFEIGSPGEALTSTQYGIMGHFVGPSHTSAIAFGTEPFGQVVPDVLGGGFKTYDAVSAHKKRTFALFYPSCVRVTTVATILLRIAEEFQSISENWAYASATTVTVATGAASRYAINQEVRMTQVTGGFKAGTIAAVADTVLTLAGIVVENETIFDKFVRQIRGTKILQMESTSMLRTQNI